MKLRNLDYADDTPPASLGPAALDAILERGDLGDWRPLAEAVKREPFGRLADWIRRVCAAHPMYGTSALWTTWIETLRKEDEGSSVPLAGLRQRRGLTQHEIADRMGSTQSDVSKLERRTDLRLSTLRSYVQALGGVVEIRARFGSSALRIQPPRVGRSAPGGEIAPRGASDVDEGARTRDDPLR